MGLDIKWSEKKQSYPPARAGDGIEIDTGGDGGTVALIGGAALAVGVGLVVAAITLAPGLNVALVVIGSAAALRIAAPAIAGITRVVVWAVMAVHALPQRHRELPTIEGEYRRLEDNHDLYGR